ncbi:unnamed protein product [Adineta steineri]|uniref:Uncharacterized protein n=1 Tax=Adineta steineri TaxID=433720 RepID=A0A816D7L2_9BILA|nr:unnamed protein product [Adineta steineri]CAF1632713.1 unnamed protein product [Adineta steineri]
MGQAPISECSVGTGAQVSTWRLKGSGLGPNPYQDCYMPSFVTLVRNEYVYYRFKVSNKWMVEAEIWLYDVETKDRACLIYSDNFIMAPLDGGITWNSTTVGTHYTMAIGYPKINFLTTIQFNSTSQPYASHFNIYVWLSSSLVANSIGICRQSDPDCRPTEIISTTTKTTTTTTSTTTVTTSTTTSTTTVTTSTTTTNAQTTTATSVASFKCAIYENMYIQTWHHTNEASPPIKNCAGSSGNFEIVKNKFVRYTLRTTGSSIDELTLILFDELSTKAICTVSAVGQDFGWMDCEENDINPSLITTATHETLTVYYAKGNFTTIVTHDIGFNVGRFVINVYQSSELATHSTGICNLSSSCAANGRI